MSPKKYPPPQAELSELNEAVSTYVSGFYPTLNKHLQSGKIDFSDIFEDKILIIKAIREGIPFRLFSALSAIMPFSDDDWAEFLSLSLKTLQRYRKDEGYRFKSIHSEKIIEMAEVTYFGNQVFDTSEQYYEWLNTPSYALGGYRPSELLKDSYGKELVMAELNRIDQGIFA